MSCKKIVRNSFIGGFFVTFMVFSGSVNAALSVESLFNNGTYSLIQDLSGENFYRFNTQTQAYEIISSGSLQKGDFFAGVFNIDTINNQNIGNGTSYNELTGSFLTEISSILSNTGTQTGSLSGVINTSTFGFTTAGSSAWSGILGIDMSTFSGGVDVNSMVILMEDSAQNLVASDFTNSTLALAHAIDGTFVASLGFDATKNDHYWTGTGPENIADIFAAGFIPGDKLGSYAFGMDVLQNNFSGVTFANLAPKDFQWAQTAGNIYVADGAFGYQVQDDIKSTFITNNVPEPSIIGLLSIGLLVIGASAQRRNHMV